MTKKLFAILFLTPLISFVTAQKKDTVATLSKEKYVIINLEKDTIKLRDKASQTLRALRNGAVIVRLKTNEKSVEAYRKAGRNNVADRIIEDRRTQNQKLFFAFITEFKFCNIYFIYANQTKSFLEGNHKIFLNKELAIDSSIIFNDTTFVFCEYGSVESFSNFTDIVSGYRGWGDGMGTYADPALNRILDTVPTQTSTSPATYSGLAFLDKDLHQFYRPFPYVEGVYLDNFAPSVRTLNNELERAYYRLVVKRDFKEQEKKERRKPKAERKKEKWIP